MLHSGGRGRVFARQREQRSGKALDRKDGLLFKFIVYIKRGDGRIGRPIQLRPRLMTLASHVPPGSRVADIGTDHARLPIYLLQRGVVDYVIATDAREGPLSMAAEALRRRGLLEKADLRLCDGALGLRQDEADCLIIAGMGGDTIAMILRATPWLADKHLLLQPQTHPERVLDVLVDWSKIPKTITVSENNRRYVIFEVYNDTGTTDL